jgi:hypothetical protein
MNKTAGFSLRMIVFLAAGCLVAAGLRTAIALSQGAPGQQRSRGLIPRSLRLLDTPEVPRDFMALPQAEVDAVPEFYFTRLIYSNSGRRGRWGMGKPPQFTCPEFGGGGQFPRAGGGWATDYPSADCKFMGGVHRLTGVRVHPDPNVIEIMDPDLFRFPYLYAVEVGGMFLSNEEAARLREYLLRGGFLHADDFWGLWEKANFEDQMLKVFPDRTMQELPLSHPVFHTFYDLDSVMQIPNVSNGCRGGRTWESRDDTEPRIYGIFDDHERLMVLSTYNSDLGDAWEWMDVPCYPETFSSQAYRMGINFMVYSMSH